MHSGSLNRITSSAIDGRMVWLFNHLKHGDAPLNKRREKDRSSRYIYQHYSAVFTITREALTLRPPSKYCKKGIYIGHFEVLAINLWCHLEPQTVVKPKNTRSQKKQWLCSKTCRKIYKHVRKIRSTWKTSTKTQRFKKFNTKLVQLLTGFKKEIVDFLRVFLSFFAQIKIHIFGSEHKKIETWKTCPYPRPTTSCRISGRNIKKKVMAIQNLKNCWKMWWKFD